MIRGDYNNRGDSYGSGGPNNQQYDGYNTGNYQQQYQQLPSPPQPPVQYTNQSQFYGQPQQQPSSFYNNNRSMGIAGSPAQSTPAVPNLSEEDIKIFKDTQRDVMFKRFFPAAILGCAAIYMAHQRKIIKPSGWTYGIYLGTTSYITQLSARSELKRRIAESSSMSPFAEQVRMQLGHANRSSGGAFVEPSDFSYSQSTPSTGTQYSPYNRYNRQKSQNSSEFADEFLPDEKDLTEFSPDARSVQERGSTEFAPDDVVAGDSGFRTRRPVDPMEKIDKPRSTYEELRMRNRAQYTSTPSPGNTPYMQPPPSNNDPSGTYSRPGTF